LAVLLSILVISERGIDTNIFLLYIAYVRNRRSLWTKSCQTRIDEAVIQHINALAKRLGTSKKAVLENAIRCYFEKIEAEQGFDIF
jgi:hypothetical protein